MSYRVFISYATDDLKMVNYLAGKIRRAVPLADIFVAKRCVPAGSKLAYEIYTALINADTVILLWTPVSQVSNWVKTEGEYSFILGKHLIQIMSERGIYISRSLRTLKYEAAYGHRSVEKCLRYIALNVAKRAWPILYTRCLVKHAEAAPYSISRDDDAFYSFALRVLQVDNRDTLFISGSPIAVLPFETTTHARKEYLKLLHSRFLRRGEMGVARYIFNKNRTFDRLRAKPGEVAALPGHLHLMRPLIESSRFNLLASRQINFLPSGLITPTEGALVLKDPSEPDRTVGVYFVKGKQLEDVVRSFRYLTRPKRVESATVWLPEIMKLSECRSQPEQPDGTQRRFRFFI